MREPRPSERTTQEVEAKLANLTESAGCGPLPSSLPPAAAARATPSAPAEAAASDSSAGTEANNLPLSLVAAPGPPAGAATTPHAPARPEQRR